MHCLALLPPRSPPRRLARLIASVGFSFNLLGTSAILTGPLLFFTLDIIMLFNLIITVFIVLLGIAICFIDPKANNAGPNWFWRGGKNDLFRNLLCRPDGSFRRYTKLGILIWWAVCLAIFWSLSLTK